MKASRVVGYVLFLAIAGCGTTIYSVKQDEGLAQGAVIRVLPTMQSEVRYAVFNNLAKNVSMAIAIGAGAIEQNRGRAIREQMGEFDMLGTFHDHLENALQERGLTVEWAGPRVVAPPGRNVSIPRSEQRDGFALRSYYPPAPSPDQNQLEIAVQFSGFAAAGTSAEHPLRPTVAINVRMVSGDGRRVVFQNSVNYNPILGGDETLYIDADPDHVWADYEALRAADPALLRQAMDAALKATAERLAAAL